jgi:thymidine phosphorylase
MDALETLTTEELEAKQQQYNAERAALRVQAIAVQRVMDGRIAAAALTARLAAMSDAEKALLLQMVQAGTVLPTEGMGTPGG